MYSENENKDAKAHFAFLFQIFNFPSVFLYNAHGHFSSKFSQQLLALKLHLQVGKVYCVNGN